MIFIFGFFLSVLPFVLARVGDPCTYNGLPGVCTDVSDCTTGFTVSNFCPNDPSNVKCCIGKSCTDTTGKAGTCLNDIPSKCSGTFISGRCPGPSDVKCCIADDVNVEFWINAFIPLSVPGITKPYPQDPSKSMINGLPIIGDCFLTDQRDYSNNIAASARMHSQASITITASGYQWTQQHYCGESVEVDCEDGDVEGRKTQSSDGMSFNLLSGTSSRVVLNFNAAENNPLFTGSPDINLLGTLTVDRASKFVEFVGKVDDFPAFEAYVSINGGTPRTIAQLKPDPGSGPDSLFGDANRSFQGRVSF